MMLQTGRAQTPGRVTAETPTTVQQLDQMWYSGLATRKDFGVDYTIITIRNPGNNDIRTIFLR